MPTNDRVCCGASTWVTATGRHSGNCNDTCVIQSLSSPQHASAEGSASEILPVQEQRSTIIPEVDKSIRTSAMMAIVMFAKRLIFELQRYNFFSAAKVFTVFFAFSLQ
jgi:hypothetical protein